jgi:prepilin-type N-terminal cleavage/methylation domain-containing protein
VKWLGDERGFTVVEMLVAMAIVAITFIPIVGLTTNTTRLHIRQNLMIDRQMAQASALTLLRGVNPTEEPNGTRDLGGTTRLEWRATMLSAPRRSLRFLGGEGDFVITLYRLDAKLSMPDDRFSIERIGWQNTKQQHLDRSKLAQ